MKTKLLTLCCIITLQSTAWAQQDSLVSQRDSSFSITMRATNERTNTQKNEKYLGPAIIVGLIIAGTILLFNVRSK